MKLEMHMVACGVAMSSVERGEGGCRLSTVGSCCSVAACRRPSTHLHPAPHPSDLALHPLVSKSAPLAAQLAQLAASWPLKLTLDLQRD